MDVESSTSSEIKSCIPQELQNEVYVIAAKQPRKAAKPADLDDNQKRWLVVGICLHSVISPALRNYVHSVLKVFHNELIRYYKIDTQIYLNHQQRDPQTGAFLNYEVVNNNKVNYGKNIAKYDYTIKNALDLSKLFLQTQLTRYTGFDETCDSSVLLGLILNIAKFDPVIKSDADDVRKTIRNPWAHCDFTEWDASKYTHSFQLMKKIVKDLKLSLNEERLIIEEMEKWEINGQRFLSGTTHGLELLNEFRKDTHVLAVYATMVASYTDDNFLKIKKELEKFEIILNQIVQLDKEMRKGFSEIDNKLIAQDNTMIKHGTHIEELEEDVSRCPCQDSHNVDLERWKDQEVTFVETPVVKVISQILESQQSVLLVGEPGIGKSMLMHHIALQIHNKKEYSIIPCSEIQDIRYHFKTEKRQLFVIDDICGRFTISLRDIEYLQKNEDSLKHMLEKGKSKIVATCRLDIYNDEKFQTSCSHFISNTFNLSAEYSKKDKLTICTKYLKESNIQLLRDQNEPFTPLMCYLYSKNENFSLTEFLHCPYDTYRKEWEKLPSIDPYKYCALFLCVIFNGIIRESLFDIYNENLNIDKKVLKTIFDICRVNRCTSSSKMKKVLDGIIGTYLRKTRTEYRVIHDQMFDFMCCYFGNNDTLVRCILRHADINVLNERTQLESINKQYGNFTIIISKQYEPDYYARIQNDLQSGKLNQCVYSAQMKHAIYRTSLLKLLKAADNNFQIDHHMILESMITFCLKGYYEFVKYFIFKNININKGYSNNSPLTAACLGGNENIVQLLIDKGSDVNQVDGIRLTPLIAASKGGHETIVQLLIDKGCDVNQADGIGRTPLTTACSGGHEQTVQLLIEKGCDVNQDDDQKMTPLTHACQNGNVEIVKLLIEKGCVVNQHDCKKKLPLTHACQNGNKTIVKLLIDQGCDVNQHNDMEETPLTVACVCGHERIVKLLIHKGGNVNQVDGMRKTPLTAACHSGNEKIVQLITGKGGDVHQEDGTGKTPLLTACYGENEKIVQILIDRGVDVNQANGTWDTPLTGACWRGNEKIAHLLLERGCDVNKVDGQGETPLTAACKSGNAKIAQLLIEKGGDVNLVNCINETPLTAACKRGNEKIVHLLIDKGCGVNKFDGIGMTPLTAACKGGHKKMVQILIDNECDIVQVNGYGETPLIAACNGGHDEIVQLLIDNGCDVNQDDSLILTPLITACHGGHEKTVQLLIDKGCAVQVDGVDETPLKAACKGGNEKIVHLLIDKGCDVNQVDDMRETPLTAACMRENRKMVQILIDKGGDVNQMNGLRITPLIAACMTENEKIVHLLINKGGCVNQVDGMKKSPLTTICSRGNAKILRLLIDKGGDVNLVNGMGETPMIAACKNGNVKIVQLLLEKGCDVNKVDGMKKSPLTTICNRGYAKILRLLIDKGVDVNLVDGMGETPLIAACKKGNVKIVQLLLEKGCDVNKAGNKGITPLAAARRINNQHIEKLLTDKDNECLIL